MGGEPAANPAIVHPPQCCYGGRAGRVAEVGSLGVCASRMAIRCPHCSETEARTKLRQPFQFSLGFLLLAFLGGMIGGLFYGLGQDSKFRCARCSEVFYSATTVSRIFFVLCIITCVTVAALIAYGLWGSSSGR